MEVEFSKSELTLFILYLTSPAVRLSQNKWNSPWLGRVGMRWNGPGQVLFRLLNLKFISMAFNWFSCFSQDFIPYVVTPSTDSTVLAKFIPWVVTSLSEERSLRVVTVEVNAQLVFFALMKIVIWTSNESILDIGITMNFGGESLVWLMNNLDCSFPMSLPSCNNTNSVEKNRNKIWRYLLLQPWGCWLKSHYL